MSEKCHAQRVLEETGSHEEAQKAFMAPALEAIREFAKRRDDFLKSCVAFQTILSIKLADGEVLVCLYVSHNAQGVVVSKDGAMRRIPFLATRGFEKP